MIPVGYMAKRVVLRPDWLQAEQVVDIYSVSDCVSDDFADYIPHWKHNGYWFFDSPRIIRQLAQEHSIDMNGTTLFYYEVYEMEFDEERREWLTLDSELPFAAKVEPPTQRVLEGYDIVSFSIGNSAECSPLSCNSLASEVETNSHCLLNSLEGAKQILESDKINGAEPGPYRIFAVYSVNNSDPSQ